MKGFNRIDKTLTDLNMRGLHSRRGILYNTVVYSQVGASFQLNSGGWRTMSTKKAINKCLPDGYYLTQRNFEWILETPDGEIEYTDNMEIKL